MRWLSILVLASQLAAADEVTEKKAKQLYQDGKAAYAKRDFQTAVEAFKRAYMLSSEPAFLFNIASALQELEKWDEAAETLEAYLRVRPKDPDKVLIEERIRALKEKQRMLAKPSAPSDPMEAALAEQVRAQSKEALRIGDFYRGGEDPKDYQLTLDAGACYLFSGVSAEMSKLYMYLWSQQGTNWKRVADLKTEGKGTMSYCAAQTGVHKFQVKGAGKGKYVVGIYKK
jgi:tetratricopeptide (TPR) repeat protein